MDRDISNFIFSDGCYVKTFENRLITWSKLGENTPISQPKTWNTGIMIWGGISLTLGKLPFT